MSSSPTPVEGSEKFDWMADDDASQCVICDKPFGRIKNRRHHCRHCGRLVCGLCSSRKHVLRAGEEPRRVCDDCFDCLTIKQQVKAQAKGKVDREVLLLNTSSKVSDTLVRLYFLDGSFKTLYYDDYTTAAELVAKVCFSVKVALFEVKLDMRDTSEYQLVPADESIMNILSRWTLNNLNFSKLVVPIYDIHSTMKANTIPDSTVTRLSNFVMPSTMPPPPPQQLASQENVAPGIGGISLCGNNSSVIAREGSGSSMNVNSLLSAVSVPPGTPPRRRDRDDESVMTGGTGIRSSFAANSRASLSFKPNNGGSASLLPPSGIMTIQQLIHVDLQAMVSNTYDEDMSDIGSVMGGGGVGHCINIAQEMQATIRQLSEDYNKLRTETDDLKKKHELLKSIQRNRNNTGSVRDSISMRKHASTMMNATPAPVTPVSKANEFLEIYRSEGMSDSEDEDGSNIGQLCESPSRAAPTSRATFAAPSPTKKHPNSLTRGHNISAASSTVGSKKYEQDLSSSLSSSGAITAAADAFNNNAAYNSIFSRVHKNFDADYLAKLKPGLQAKVFFNTLMEIENFILSYENLVKNVTMHESGSSKGVHSNSSSVAGSLSNSPTKIRGPPAVTAGTDALMVLDPKYIITIYEIMNAMEGLYEFLFRYAEDWNRSIKDWLFRSLKQYMTLPIEQPDVLKVILYCITRENKLFAPETILVVQQVIAESFEEPDADYGPHSKSKPSSLAGVLKSVNRMVDTLNYVVGDLVPLLPPEFNVIRMFTERANIKIREDINTFYENNRNDIGNRDLLKLLSFADRQEHVLRKFGVDTSVVTQLSQDLLLQYSNTTQSLMKQWILRIAEADEKASVVLINSDTSQDMYSNVIVRGQITHWPEDLMKCVSEQLILIQKELEDETRDSVSLLILKLLVEYVKKSRVYLEVLSKSSETCPNCIEKLCAYINNNRRFVELLKEQEVIICEHLEGTDVINRYATEFLNAVNLFKDEAVTGVSVLTKVISLDFKEALKMSLFQPNSQWLDGPIVIKSLQATLKDYIKDLHKWLSHPTEDGNKIITGVIKYIIYYYIEILLTSSHSIRLSHVILARIEEDVKCLNEVFKEYLASLFDNRLELLMLDLKPLNDLITLCHMDFKDAGTVMVNFIKTELYRDFGSSCIKVWQVIMNMKGESKDVQEAIYNNVMHGGWNPAPVKPLITISYLETNVNKIKKSASSKENKDSK